MKKVDVYVSKNDNLLKQVNDVTSFDSTIDGNSYQLKIDLSKEYQTIDGCGASFTDSSAYLVNQVLNEADRKDFMMKLFDVNEGIGLSFIRNPMGASDFARDFYTYNDLNKKEEDFDLKKFSIAHDEKDIIPLTRWAKEINPEIKLMATPWSPPGWMKTSDSTIGGSLRYKCYDVYANYFVKFIKEYEKHGLDIDYISVQNEPDYSPGHYPGMKMTPVEQAHFIKYHLYPAFKNNNLKTKILCYDHNWDYYEYPEAVLKLANDEVDGIAWHVYGGHVSSQSKLHELYPTKEVHFSESSGGEWVHNPLSSMIKTGIDVFRNWSRSYVLWNIALDENNGPFVPGFGKSTCHGLVTISQSEKKVIFNRVDYFVLGHFSKVARPNAVRVDSNYDDVIQSVAFKNKDGSIGLIFSNNNVYDVKMQIIINDEIINYVAPRLSHTSMLIKK